MTDPMTDCAAEGRRLLAEWKAAHDECFSHAQKRSYCIICSRETFPCPTGRLVAAVEYALLDHEFLGHGDAHDAILAKIAEER